MVFKQFYTLVQNGKKTQFKKAFMFLIGGGTGVPKMEDDRGSSEKGGISGMDGNSG